AVDREVEAAGALQARDVPVVDDLDLDLGHEEDDHPAEPGLRGPVVGKPVRLRCVVAVRPERADYPVGVDDAAGEAPAAADQVTALDRVAVPRGASCPATTVRVPPAPSPTTRR